MKKIGKNKYLLSAVFLICTYLPVATHFEKDIATGADWSSVFDFLLWGALFGFIFQVVNSFIASSCLYLFLFAAFYIGEYFKILNFGSPYLPGDMTLGIRYVLNSYSLGFWEISLCLLLGVIVFLKRKNIDYGALRVRLLKAVTKTGIFLLLIFLSVVVLNDTINFRLGYHRKNAARSGALFYFSYLYFFNTLILIYTDNSLIYFQMKKMSSVSLGTPSFKQ